MPRYEMASNARISRLKYFICLFIFLFIFLGTCFLWYRTSFASVTVALNKSFTNRTATVKYHSQDIQQMTLNKTVALNITFTHWIVITTVKYPSKDIQQLAEIKGWQVLVIGDLKTPSNWTYPGCVFLGIDQQRALGFQITSYLPTNSYTRKIIGYLYAIQHGAKYIYDTDDDNHPSGGKISFNQLQLTSGLIYDDFTEDVMNPYAHFGQPSIWPRGFPLDRVSKLNNNTYKLCTFKTPAIQQGLVNGDPDVDAIFRLTRKEPNKSLINVTFDARAPPVTLPEGVFAPFNSQNTFFTYDAFWALFLPTSVAFRVTDIWRGYWAQRLLWLIGQRLSFCPPNAVQFRNSHNYLADFHDENQFYLQTDAFVQFLKNWTCATGTFFQCISQLGHKMSEAEFWSKSDGELLDSWLSSLVAIGYQEPKMGNAKEECLKKQHSSKVYFSPVVQNDQTYESGLRDINRFCDDYFNISSIERTTLGQRINPKIIFDDVLLIIVFNFPFYKNIRLLDALYYDHFPNIVYCGQTESFPKLINETAKGPFSWRQRQISFVNITSNKGYFGYECAIRAMEMGYNVEGYLVLGDDVMFNLWNFESNKNINLAQMQLPGYRTINRSSGLISWPWWNSYVGKKPLEKAFGELESLASKNPDEIQNNLISKYLKNRKEANLNMSVVSLGVSDLYYIPNAVSNIFVEVMKIFLKNNVFLEIAVPTTIAGLNPDVCAHGFTGISIWYNERRTTMKHFNSTKHYLHPIKLSQLFGVNNATNVYCRKYVSQLLKNW